MKAARLKAGVTQLQLAQKIGRRQSYVSKIESGERQLTVLELIDACTILGIRPSEFLEDFAASKD